MKHDERGFATIAILVLAPLFLAAIATTVATFSIVKEDGATRHLCRVDLLKAQAEVARDLQALMALNPEAEELRLERDEAEEEVRDLAESPAEILAVIHLAEVIAAQTALRAEQQALITKAKLTSQSAPRLSIAHVRSALESAHRVQRSQANVAASFRSQTTGGQFDVVATPKSSLTPDYNPSRDFSAKQEMRATWSLDVGAVLPEWLKKIIPATGFTMKTDCSTTLTPEKMSWQPQITMGKRSLSSSLLRQFL